MCRRSSVDIETNSSEELVDLTIIEPLPNTVPNPSHISHNNAIPFHSIHSSNHYTVHYPDHNKRVDSAIYKKTHHELCHLQDMPCFICGITNKSSGLSLETHHFYCEKAAQNAIDWIKFGKFAQHCYNIQTGVNIGNNFDWAEVEKNPDIFVDSIFNMIVLCKEHHTSANKGIHHIPFPEWILQKCPKSGFQFLE
jgi:hypothetical protein